MSFSINIREQDGLRTLHFESERVQGAMRIGQPSELVLEYTRVMMASLLLREGGGEAAGHPPAYSSRVLREGGGEAAGYPPAFPSRAVRDENRFPRNVLLIGLGAASQARFLYHHYPLARLTAVEIAPHVVAAAREHFELPDDPARLEIVIGDGFAYMQQAGPSFDLILVDGFNEFAHPGDLNTLPFYRACRARLSEQGLLAVNLIGLSHSYRGGFAHIATAFDQRAVLFPRCRSGNTIAFAATGARIDLALDELKSRALELEARTGLALLPTLLELADAPACQGGRLSL